MLLSGEICLTSDRQITSEATGRPSLGPFESIAKGERMRWKPIALRWATSGVIKQKSADGVVAKRSP